MSKSAKKAGKKKSKEEKYANQTTDEINKSMLNKYGNELMKYEKKIAKLLFHHKSLTERLFCSEQKLQQIEEDVSQICISIIKKREKSDQISQRINKDLIYKKIEDNCKNVLDRFLEPLSNSSTIAIEVSFQKECTLFKIPSDYLRTFGEFKAFISPHYSVSADDIFFTDLHNNIFPDSSIIYTELFPLGKEKLKHKIPKINLILRKNMSFDELITKNLEDAKIDFCLTTKTTDINKDSDSKLQEYQKRKLLEEVRIRKLEASTRKKELIKKFKGIFITLIYLSVIIMWIAYLFSKTPFKNSNNIRSMIYKLSETILNPESYNSDPLIFYSQFSSFLMNDTTFKKDYYENSEYSSPFFVKNNILNKGQLIQKLYNSKNCSHLKSNWFFFHEQINLTCYDKTENISRFGPHDNQVYVYDNPAIDFGSDFSNYDSSGFQYLLEFNNQTKVANAVQELIQRYDSDSVKSGWIQYSRAMLFVIQINFFNPSYHSLTCTFQIIRKYNYDIMFYDTKVYTIFFSNSSTNLQSLNIAVITLASLLILFTIFDTISISFGNPSKLKEIFISKNKQPDLNLLDNKKFWSLNAHFLRFKIYLPKLGDLQYTITLILLIISSIISIDLEKEIDSIVYDADTFYSCRNEIYLIKRSQYLDAVVIQLLVISLLQYMSEWIPSFDLFSRIISNFFKESFSLGIMIIWILLSLTLYGLYTFGPYLNHMNQFYYIFANLIFITLKQQQFLVTKKDYEEYKNMKKIIGNFSIVWYVLFTYIIVTFILFNIITSIITKSIHETKEDIKEKIKQRKKLWIPLINQTIICKKNLASLIKGN